MDFVVDYIPIPILELLFPIAEPQRVRDRPLQVLCLGLGRTGTDSLRSALQDLGYSEVHHGFHLIDPANVGECVQWYRLALAKFRQPTNPAFLNRQEFDKVLGNCEAVTDMPSASFAPELLRAYPEAKVILNKRSDIDAWYESQRNTIDLIFRDWPTWSRQWFESEVFWIARIMIWVARAPYDWDFKANGKAVYASHYAKAEEECRRQGREWLEWKVQDGWEPLCRFLDKSVPDKLFPNENALASGSFAQKRAVAHAQRRRRADRNILIAAVVVTAGLVAVAGWYMSSIVTKKQA